MNSVCLFLQRKGIVFSFQRYGIEALSAMAMGLFCSLIAGLILETLGRALKLEFLAEIGLLAKSLTGPLIGVATAKALRAPFLVLLACGVAGASGGQFGGPLGSFLAAALGAEAGKAVQGETKMDIVIVPAVAILCGALFGRALGPAARLAIEGVGLLVMRSTELAPIPMGALVASLMGITLTSPLSSAAVSLMLNLSGLAAGASTVGCCCHMIGFAVMSFKENGWQGLAAQGLGTSMLQMPNIMRNPLIILPPTAAALLLGPLATTALPLENMPAAAGMGSSGLVGPFGVFSVMGFTAQVSVKVILLCFVLPGFISQLFCLLFRRLGFIKPDDLALPRF